MPPTLHTDRLTLRPFTVDDAPDVYAYASNPNVSRYTTWPRHTSLAFSEGFIAMVHARPPTEPTWAICLRGEPRVIGAIEYGPTDAAVAEIHFSLAEPLWGRGLMTEAAGAVLAWGWATFPNVTRVRSRAAAENVGSRRVMEKCGLRFTRVCCYRWMKSPTPVAQAEYEMERPA